MGNQHFPAAHDLSQRSRLVVFPVFDCLCAVNEDNKVFFFALEVDFGLGCIAAGHVGLCDCTDQVWFYVYVQVLRTAEKCRDISEDGIDVKIQAPSCWRIRYRVILPAEYDVVANETPPSARFWLVTCLTPLSWSGLRDNVSIDYLPTYWYEPQLDRVLRCVIPAFSSFNRSRSSLQQRIASSYLRISTTLTPSCATILSNTRAV